MPTRIKKEKKIREKKVIPRISAADLELLEDSLEDKVISEEELASLLL